MLRGTLRKIGLALILLPEPFTTPFGLVLLGATYFFPRSSKVDSSRQLRGLIRLYFNHARLVSPPGKIIQHKLKERLVDYEWRGVQPDVTEKQLPSTTDIIRLIKQYGEKVHPCAIVHHSLDQRWTGYIWPGQSAVPLQDKMIYHAIGSGFVVGRDDDRISKSPMGKMVYHTIVDSFVTGHDNELAAKTALTDKIILHNLKSSLSGYVLLSQPQKKIVSHSLGTAKLRPAPVRAR